MMTRRLLVFALSAALSLPLLVASRAHAGTWYWGIGPEFGRVSSEEETLLDGQEGAGIILLGGHRFTPLLSLDLCISGPAGNKFTHSMLSLGTKFDFIDLGTGKWTPWAAVYLTAHVLDWEDLDYEADKLGLSLGLGADFLVSPKNVIQPAIRYHPFDAPIKGPGGTDLGTFEAETVELTVSYVHHYW